MSFTRWLVVQRQTMVSSEPVPVHHRQSWTKIQPAHQRVMINNVIHKDHTLQARLRVPRLQFCPFPFISRATEQQQSMLSPTSSLTWSEKTVTGKRMSVAVNASVLGSTSSSHVLSAEPIPREYHRKVLKKIAQLTKVTVLPKFSF